MRIVNLTSQEYEEFTKENDTNFGQTVEYTRLYKYPHEYLALIDDDNLILAATIILIKKVSSLVKEAIAPNGFIIDYTNKELLKQFTFYLKQHLKKEGITYLITNPMYKYKVYDKNNNLLLDNEDIHNTFISLNYINIGHQNPFERYDVIIENKNSLEEIFKDFTRNTKRNIKEAGAYGLTLTRSDNIELFYNIIHKKTNRSIEYYQSIYNVYNSNNSEAIIYFVTLDPNKYLIRIKQKLEEVEKENKRITKLFTKYQTKRNLNHKLDSDKTVEKYKNILNKAIILNQENPKPIEIATSMLIKNNHEIYFIIDGYKEEFRYIHATHILKWYIIHEYFNQGYRIFNLGEISNNYLNKNDKYIGLYKYKIGFSGNIIEYSPNLLLIISKAKYNLFRK